MELLFSLIILIIAWGFVVKLVIKSEPKSGVFKKIIWLLFWFVTFSFLFGSSSTASSSGDNNYGGGYDDWSSDDDNYHNDDSFDTCDNDFYDDGD